MIYNLTFHLFNVECNANREKLQHGQQIRQTLRRHFDNKHFDNKMALRLITSNKSTILLRIQKMLKIT